MTNSDIGYSQQMEYLGIRQYENYTANVISVNSKGCILQLESGLTVMLSGSYPKGTVLQISFEINEVKRRVYPIVEWVVSYGDIFRAA